MSNVQRLLLLLQPTANHKSYQILKKDRLPPGAACPWGAAFSERAVWPEKATYGRLSSRKGGGLLYLILNRFACVNKYIIETQ